MVTTLLQIFIPLAYFPVTLVGARTAYRLINWEDFTGEGERVVFSFIIGAFWPVTGLVLSAVPFIKAPSRRERKEMKLSELNRKIAEAEYELGMR